MSRFDLVPDPSDYEASQFDHWIDVAREVAGILAADALERDRANAVPVAEIALLRERGLLTITVPERFGGAGVPWSVTAQIVRLIARADSSIAHILGYHYVWLRFIVAFETPQAERALRSTVEHAWLWASPGNNRLTGYPPLVAEDGGYRVTGDSGFASGGPLADRLFALVIEEGALTVVEIDPADSGVSFHGDWDVLGQRLSASQSITLDDVRFGEDAILRRYGPVAEPQEPRQSVLVLHFQLVFSILHLGLAEGAVLAAVEYTREHTRPALHSTVERGRDEHYVLDGYGSAVARLQSVSALVERSIRALEWLYDLGAEVTAEQRAAVAEIVASAKVVSTQVGLDVTSGVFEFTGARSTASRVGLDRYWRGLRTISLHDPVSYKREEIGRYVVNGEAPLPSGIR